MTIEPEFSVAITTATAQRLMDWGVLHYANEGWTIDLDIWEATRPDTRPTVPDKQLTDVEADLENEARRFAAFYPEGSDGRNTFVMFADKIAAALKASTERTPHPLKHHSDCGVHSIGECDCGVYEQ